MINIISQLSRHANLLKNIQFMFHRKPRDPSVPTQSSILEPFSINKLHDNPGARYYPKILGRGRASGKGKTCGRGHKGHWARQGGGPHVRFEGGQTPIQKRLPKYGKVKENRPRQLLDYVNLSTIDYYIKLGVLNPQQTITIKTLVDTGIVKKVKFGVKILGKGADRITQPLKFEVTDASKTAIKYVTEQGGEIKLIHRTPLKLKEHVFPDKYPIPLMDPITPYWKVKKLMRKEEDRGLPISYPKPQWLSDDIKKEGVEQARAKQIGSKSSFEFPVPIVQNSGKIRKRKPQVYRKFNYNLP